ncbi:hypothetical protein JCM10908_004605 [Rhodotorula pacifica]|uniref:uncharacterized protein n=1 Tax=Rhodotorula pacifica TaxID=1495444 RepID=UPI0031804A00
MSLPEDLNMAALPKQPYSSPRLLKWFYCTHRVSSSLALLPYWAIKYALGKRPRPSWSIRETLLIDFTRRVSAISDQAGVQHAVRDPKREPKRDELKETRFEWAPGISGDLCCGVLDDEEVKPLDKVGTFVWERAEDVQADYSMINGKTSADDDADTFSNLSFQPSIAGGDRGDLVGVYLHGGGYTHFSAHESAQTSMIPRRLMQYDYFASIHAVEYRMLPESPFPSAVQDAVSVYAHLVRSGVPANKIVIIGDSAGGNIALAVARWIRDHRKVPAPGGLLLLSPWCDPSRCFPECINSYVPRPNPEDYLADAPAARRLLVTSLLGSKPHDYLASPYISPASALGPHGSFDEFPPTFIHYGDAERLIDEIEALVCGMKRDRVEVDVEKTPDAVHDVLMVRFWNENVRAHIYKRICGWLDDLVKRSGGPSRSRAGSTASQLNFASLGPVASTSGTRSSRKRAPSGGADLRRAGASVDSLQKSNGNGDEAKLLSNGRANGGRGQIPRTGVVPVSEGDGEEIEEIHEVQR